MTDTKAVRRMIRSRLTEVALPDSRFHLDFAEFIPDFIGSDRALARLRELRCYRAGRYAFITPDNCLAALRTQMLLDAKAMVVSTYGIYRGFVLLEPDMVPEGQEIFAGWLDGLEHFGRSVTLAEIAARGAFDFMVTGASAVSLNGVRFGKGHGFFDLEWGMFTDMEVADERTPVVAVVHDAQVVEDMLSPSPTDITVDYIATPDRLHEATREDPRPRGVKWELLSAETIEATPPLEELQALRGERVIQRTSNAEETHQ